MSERRPQVSDVAKIAGVSPATVSRFLNGKLHVTPKVEERIRAAVATLRYSPHSIARTLATGNSRVIGLIVPDIANPFFAEMAEAVESVAYDHGYTVMLCNTKNDAKREERYIQIILSQQVDGLIYMGAFRSNPYLSRVSDLRLPFVVVDEDVEDVEASRVFVDNYGGARLIVQHLLEYGHQRIAFLGGPDYLFTTQERYRGYRDALSGAGHPVRDTDIFLDTYTIEAGHQSGERILAAGDRPTAVFASSISLVLGFLSAAKLHKVLIPDDLSLVGFDDVAMTKFLSPALSTVTQPIPELAATAFEELLRFLNNQSTSYSRVILPVSLALRDSVSRPATRAPPACLDVLRRRATSSCARAGQSIKCLIHGGGGTYKHHPTCAVV